MFFSLTEGGGIIRNFLGEKPKFIWPKVEGASNFISSKASHITLLLFFKRDLVFGKKAGVIHSRKYISACIVLVENRTLQLIAGFLNICRECILNLCSIYPWNHVVSLRTVQKHSDVYSLCENVTVTSKYYLGTKTEIDRPDGQEIACLHEFFFRGLALLVQFSVLSMNWIPWITRTVVETWAKKIPLPTSSIKFIDTFLS